MSRALITGGAGFIGQHLAARLVPVGWDVIALDSLQPQVHLDPALSVSSFPGRVIRGDVADPASWETLPRIDLIVHLAAETGVGQSMYEVERYRRTNVRGTELAGLAARERSVPVISLSSRAVYGQGRFECPSCGIRFGAPCCSQALPAPSKESDPHLPVSVYGETKSEGELVLTGTIAGAVPVSIVRPQNVAGPGQALHNPYTGVLAAFLARLKEGRPVQVFGRGNQTRDFVHVADVADLLAWMTANPPAIGAPLVLNSGTGARTTLLDLARAAIAACPAEVDQVEHVDVHRAGDVEHACADLEAAIAVGAPSPRRTTGAAVAEFMRWGWERPAAPAAAWDQAISELTDQGLIS